MTEALKICGITLHFMIHGCTMEPRDEQRQDAGDGNPLRPYAGETPSHTTALLHLSPFYQTLFDFTSTVWGFVSICGVGFYILRRFCLSQRTRARPKGDGQRPTPTGRTVENPPIVRRGYIEKDMFFRFSPGPVRQPCSPRLGG